MVEEYAEVIAEHFGVVHAPALQQRRGRLIRSVLETAYGDYEWRFAVNLWGAIHGIKAFLPRLVALGDGRSINAS